LQLLLKYGHPGQCFPIVLDQIRQHADPPHPLGLLRAPQVAKPSRRRGRREIRVASYPVVTSS
jgi:hypothetical protein